MSAQVESVIARLRHLACRGSRSLLRPAAAFNLRYMPLVTVYFAYGALGLIDVSRDLWVKEKLTLSPPELASIGIWLSLPWTVKMVFGELVDCVPIFGSNRRSYILVGAALTASGLLVLAGAAGEWISAFSPNELYVIGTLLVVLGTVIQDVVADAMSTEVVPRTDGNGNTRSQDELRAELGMVQVLGRLALSFGILAVAGLSGWLANSYLRQTVFLLGLGVPLMSAAGSMFIREQADRQRSIDWRILGGGILYGLVVVSVAIADLPFGQEMVFVLSLGIICAMLASVTRDLEPKARHSILFAAIVIFAFRATPAVGDGYFWWTLDVLRFDAGFYGVLRQAGAVLGFVALWIFSKQITQYPIPTVLFWTALAATFLALPNVGLFYGLHLWTEEAFGVGARSIALIDAAAASPFAQLSMIPLLTLIAYHAPPAHRATWFALMASLMNLALAAGQLQTKYLNHVFVVARGDYADLGPLLITTTVIGLILPIGAILAFGRRI